MRGEHTPERLAERFDVHPTQLTPWKGELLWRASTILATASDKREAGPDLMRRLPGPALADGRLSGARRHIVPARMPK
jgi:hypothetical protein